MKPRRSVTFAIAAVTSAVVWALSPWAGGAREPWDVDGLYYLLALAAAGCVAGALAPKPLCAHYLGAILGQAAYQALFLRVGALFLIGIVLLLAYSLIFVLAAAVSGYLRTKLSPRPSER
jgi:hypothetical protein